MDSGVHDSGGFALIGLLRGLLDVGATALEQKDRLALLHEFDGEKNACCTRSDDADVSMRGLRRRTVKKIANHGLPLTRRVI